MISIEIPNKAQIFSPMALSFVPNTTHEHVQGVGGPVGRTQRGSFVCACLWSCWTSAFPRGRTEQMSLSYKAGLIQMCTFFLRDRGRVAALPPPSCLDPGPLPSRRLYLALKSSLPVYCSSPLRVPLKGTRVSWDSSKLRWHFIPSETNNRWMFWHSMIYEYNETEPRNMSYYHVSMSELRQSWEPMWVSAMIRRFHASGA